MKKTKKQKYNPQEESMNPVHELFARAYAGYGDPDAIGNKTKSYIFANKLEDRHAELLTAKQAYKTNAIEELRKFENNCAAQGLKLFRKSHIQRRINELLDNMFDDMKHVDRELAYVITQRRDLPSKAQGIKEYNRIKDRIKKTEATESVSFTWDMGEGTGKTDAANPIKTVTITRKVEDNDDVEFDD